LPPPPAAAPATKTSLPNPGDIPGGHRARWGLAELDAHVLATGERRRQGDRDQRDAASPNAQDHALSL
jgi:hypothetical protein